MLLQGGTDPLIAEIEIAVDDLQIPINPREAAIQRSGAPHLGEEGGVPDRERSGPTTVSLFGPQDQAFVGPAKQVNRRQKWRLTAIGQRHRLAMGRFTESH